MLFSLPQLWIVSMGLMACVALPQILRAQAAGSGGASLPVRTWTSNDGRTMQAQLLGVEGGVASFSLGNGQQAKLPLDRLSEADRKYIRSLSPQGTATDTVEVPPEKRVWPDTVEVSTRSIEVSVAEEDPAKQRYVYRSEFFQFVSQEKLAGSVMKEIARTFEATHTLVNALPWGVHSHPPKDLGYYQAKFYSSFRSYVLDGGPENSGGVYSSQDRVFKIPFNSLGLVMRGKTWFKDETYRNDTIVHELTHQMMHDFLPYLPLWMIEGSAEYVGMLPYNAGRFLAGSHERGFKDYVKTFGVKGGITLTEIGDVMKHMTMTREQWQELSLSSPREQHRLYFASCVLMYYFCHLDGEGKGLRLLKYFDQVGKARDEWAKFLADPQVVINADGSITYPRSMKVPEHPRDGAYGLEILNILVDGRTAEQLDAEVRAGLKKIGLR